jgi:hypothetical protein
MSEFGAPYNPNYDTQDHETLARIEALVNAVHQTPQDKLVSDGWDDTEIAEAEGIQLNPDWSTVLDPWNIGGTLEVAPIVAADENNQRHFALISKRPDETIRHIAFLYRLSSDRLLMMPTDPNDNSGAMLISWNSLDARAFLNLSEQALAIR